jgi:hypothetical protein
MIEYLHWCITALITIIFGILQYRNSRVDKHKICEDGINELKTRVAVLESKLAAENHLLERLDDKLDRISEKL